MPDDSVTAASGPPDARPIPIWMDCDPGHDDALALILAGHNERVELLGVSTVGCNQTIEKVTRNALAVLEAAGLPTVEVVPGQATPLMEAQPMLCPEIHGDSGLDGTDGQPLFPAPSRTAVEGKAVLHMAYRISQAAADRGQKVQLVCTGSLTNAALLLTLFPEIRPQLEVVLMGGCLGTGNTGPCVEFNIQTDPDAARIVFQSGIAITMVPLEVTHTALATPDVRDRLLSGPSGQPTKFRRQVVALLDYFAGTYLSVFGFPHAPVHDPCAVAFVIAPELFELAHMRVDVETTSTLTRGRTVCDTRHQTGRPPNAHVAQKMDVEGFWRLVEDAVTRADLAAES